MPPLLWGGADAVAIRVWASLVFLFQLPLVYLIGRIVWTSTTAALATLIYALVGSAFKLQGLMFNTEQALMLPALIGLWTLMRGIAEERLRWSIAYGLCLGLVSLIKPTAVPLLVPLVLFVRVGRPYAYVRTAGAMVVGMILPWLPVMLTWGVTGAWPELVFALGTYNRIYAEESLRNWDAGGVINVVAPIGALLVYAAGGVALGGWRTRCQRQRLAISLWTIAFIVAAIVSLRGYIHYYYPALPGLALLAAPVITRLLERHEGNSQLWGGIAAALLGVVLLIPFVRDAVEVSRLDGTHYFATAPAAAAYIRSVTTPEEPIFIWASEPEIYLLANRRPSSRYIYSYPLDLFPASRTQLAADLQHDPPAVVVLYHGLQPAPFTALASQRNMRLVARIGGFDIWATPTDIR
jgi:4-amino-4-deoxy-L-arabinose transferase-like glycosyltransferase